VQKLQRNNGQKVYFGIRPEDLGLRGVDDIPEADNIIKATVEVVEPLGAETQLITSVDGDQTLVARVDSHARVQPGDQVELLADPKKMHAFALEGEENLRFA
jgi:multiple sugar transport system ATP-binding protein